MFGGIIEMEPLERTLETELSEEGNARWLRSCYQLGDINGLLDAALMLNVLYHQERTKTKWLARQAAGALRTSGTDHRNEHGADGTYHPDRPGDTALPDSRA